jgi:hypothetical protein
VVGGVGRRELVIREHEHARDVERDVACTREPPGNVSIAAMWSASNACRTPREYASQPSPR